MDIDSKLVIVLFLPLTFIYSFPPFFFLFSLQLLSGHATSFFPSYVRMATHIFRATDFVFLLGTYTFMLKTRKIHRSSLYYDTKPCEEIESDEGAGENM